MRAKDIAMLLQIPKGKRSELFQVLDELEAEGKIICKKGKYEKVRKIATVKTGSPELLEGTFIAHPKGFGFVELEDQEEDLYIPQDDTMGAFHKDRVQVKVKEERTGQRREGTIVQILGHGITEVVGTFEKSKNYGFVIPDNQKIQQDIFIPREHTLGANDGDKVVAKITSYGGKNKNPEGRVQEVLGAQGAPGIDVLSIARAYELPMDFPVKVANQADRVPDHVIEGDFQGRMDLRNWTVVTIDGEDAKDLDDGISLTKDGNIYHLGVHIADVSNYVQGGSALDREALRRGTSVYLVDRVIPMLPRRLSNGICSLNQGEDRLALSCLMDIDAQGNVISHKIAETVICVDRRMTYTAVKKILEGDGDLRREYQDFVPLFHHMKELSAILRKKRRNRGSIDFDFPESKVFLDEMGRPVEINPANFKKRRRDELLVSLAGVVMNLIIAVIFAFVAKILLAVLGYSFLSGTFGNILWTMVIDIVIINLALMIFNLIPCPPLDGFSVITEIFNLKTTELYWRLYQYGNWILIALIIFGVTSKILSPCLNFLYSLLASYIIY